VAAGACEVDVVERDGVQRQGEAMVGLKKSTPSYSFTATVIGWEVGVIKSFDKKGPHAGKFSVKYKDDPSHL
jgi:hypothetical protein